MNMMTSLAPPLERLTALAELLRRFERDDMERAVDLLLAMMDAADRPLDPDAPDFAPCSDGAPGAPDDAEPDAETSGDPAFTEWLTRGRHKLYAGGWEALTANRRFGGTHEDDEDGDGCEDDDVDEDSDPGDVAHREDIYQACLHDGQAEDAEEDEPRDSGTDAEPMTWPERVRQPSCMSGGLAGCDHDDYEPARVPTTLNLDAANAS